MKNVTGKVAFITGGASGIGLGIAQAFAEAGIKVIIASRNNRRLADALRLLEAAYNVPARAVQLDVTDRQAVGVAVEHAYELFGRVDILCNSAGVNTLGPMDEATYDDWDWMLGVNLMGVVNCLVGFLPRIKAHNEGGHILNVASMGSFIPGAAAGIYTTTKFAVRGLTECLRLNLARHRVGVSLLCPGLTQSRIYESYRDRPAGVANTAFPVSDALASELAAVHAKGMDAMEVGRIALEGIRANRFYIFPHPEFKVEVAEHAQEALDAFSDDEPDPHRMVFEELRRRRKREALLAARAIE